MPPETAAPMFSQLGSISAVLGGFAFTAASALLTLTSEARRTLSITVGLAIASAASFIICALGWTLAAVQLSGGAAMSAELNLLHARLSMGFIGGILLLFAGLGLSGWIRSRGLGIGTGTVAAVATGVVLLILRSFVV